MPAPVIGSPDACIANGHDRVFCQATCRDVQLDSIATGESRDLLKCLPNDSIDAVVTSPPYADRRKKQYGGVHPDQYVEWFLPFVREIKRALKPTGSFFLNINDVLVDDQRHPYVYDLVLKMREQGWRWVDTYIWSKPNPFPGKRKRRFKDGFEYIYHFTKQKDIQFFPDHVRIPISKERKREYAKRAPRNTPNDYRDTKSATGSGFGRRQSNFFTLKTVLPSNVLHLSIETSPKAHSAAYPVPLPEFFIKASTKEGDVVLDPFSGSGTTGVAAKRNCRQFIGFDYKPEFVAVAQKRLDGVDAVCSME